MKNNNIHNILNKHEVPSIRICDINLGGQILENSIYLRS
jgi:hypothetical protein